MDNPQNLCAKIYRYLGTEQSYTCTCEKKKEFLVKLRILLEDKPGALASFASLIAMAKENIGFFHYDRANDPNKVITEIHIGGKAHLDKILEILRENYNASENKISENGDQITITTPESVLKIKVRLANLPGSLAKFARLMSDNRANVIYMFYDEDVEPQSADIALATENPDEVNSLLTAINNRGYSYKVVYRGSDAEEVEHIIGLKLVEKFFLRLRKIVNEQDFEQLSTIVDSSKKLYSELVNFYAEVGSYPEKGDIFSNILAFASTSITRVGEKFSFIELPALRLKCGIKLFTFRLPTGANISIFQHKNGDFTMFDAGYGLYYADIKKMLKNSGIDPALVKRIFITHADADHIGSTGYFADEFGTQVFMHPDCRSIMENENRAYGTKTKLYKLNKHFTALVTRLTQCKMPEKTNFFSTTSKGTSGFFNIVDNFYIDSLQFQVLESCGGHIPGQVFFLNRSAGLFFTSDYLIDVESLSNEEKNYMKLPRYLMTSTNTKSQVFKEETKSLVDVIAVVNNELEEDGKSVLIFPGHGDYYAWEEKFSLIFSDF